MNTAAERLAAWLRNDCINRQECFDAAALLQKLAAENEALKADAARYWWFADIAVTGEHDRAEAAFDRFSDAEECTKVELDAAIDAAIWGEKQ